MKKEIIDSLIRAGIQILTAASVFLNIPLVEKLLEALNLANQNLDEVYASISVIVSVAIGIYSIFIEPSKAITETGSNKLKALAPTLDRFKARDEAKKSTS